MSVNLIDLLKNAVSDSTIESFGKQTGLEAPAVKTGISAIVPTVLSALLGKNTTAAATAPSWLESIPGLFTDNAGVIVPDGKIDYLDLLAKGKGLLGNLFGNNTEAVTAAVAQNANIHTEKAGNLISLATPFVLGYLTRWMKSKNWTFGNLITNLLENKQSLVAALPAGISAAHFFSGDIPKVEMPKVEPVKVETPKVEMPKVNIPEMKTTTPIAPPKKTNNALKWLLWLLLLGLLLWVLLSKGCKSCSNEGRIYGSDTIPTTIVDTAKAKIDTLAATIKGKLNEAGEWIYDLGKDMKLKLADGTELNVGDNSAENRLVTFINDPNKPVDKTTWFTLDRLYFETGSSKLKPESEQQLRNIVAILKAYPNVKLKLGGYTDNTGPADVNKKLSQERADAALIELVKIGADKTRLAAEGYGPEFPVCPANDTPDCKAQNRRIDVRVAAK